MLSGKKEYAWWLAVGALASTYSWCIRPVCAQADPRKHVHAHVANSQSFYAIEDILAMYELPVEDRTIPVDGHSRILWLGTPTPVYDVAGNVDYLVSHSLEHNPDSAANAAAGATGLTIGFETQSYAAIWDSVDNSYDVVIVDTGDHSVERFKDRGLDSQRLLAWETSDGASVGNGFSFAGKIRWLEMDDPLIQQLEDVIGMAATPENFEVAYKTIYDNGHGLTSPEVGGKKGKKGH